VDSLPRLRASIDGRCVGRLLNDGLLTNANPAAMCRYILRVDGAEEWQASSGVWIATAAGSTGGIGSAGHPALDDPTRAALLWRVREPFQPRRRYRLLADSQCPPRGLGLVPTTPDLGLWIDGAHRTVPVPPGCLLELGPDAEPLRLLRDPVIPG
jgi:hypothetical protein